jgi:hypothetical protein
MARSVYLHIGLPKTATTYLQTICWAARDQMRADGVLLPGRERRDHLWASRMVRDDARAARRSERERTAWDRLRAELADWSGTGLVSHEFFAAASADQARRMVAALEPAEVHLVVTAREPLGLLTASWQESLKNRSTTPMAEYGRTVSDRPTDIWNWRTLDLRLVLERWSQAVRPERIHVLPLDRTAPRDDIWHRFAGVIGLPSTEYDTSQSFPNESMGVVEAEVLRRVNLSLGSFTRAFDKGVYIRSFLADEHLVPRRGEPFWPLPDQIADCRARGEEALAYLAQHPFDIVGDVANLRVPEALPARRTPDSVTEEEVAGVATQLVAELLDEIRDLRTERRQLLDAASVGPVGRLSRWWRSRPRRSGR